jgi:Icc-related predicted phosphoesterase
MIRIAAVGDVHFDRSSRGRIRDHLQEMRQQADIFLIAGDLTQTGDPEEARVLAEDLSSSEIPVVVVLGNHDYHHGHEREIVRLLEQHGVTVLEGSSVRLRVGDTEIGIAGIKGFGGGFAGACATEFGEPEMKAFIHHTKVQANKL